ncbi:cytochrome P450-like protein [Sclerotinia borealis F-4128]|uniref:Cytochrome P450-like protein n=1 Tax=Sclerotinia borealis (strain F-4128) TaxID=1432307 RepID=W9C8S1_SCLBF|nr:cytochrome P450-like protein [Sclerotinia borealis F-4128]
MITDTLLTLAIQQWLSLLIVGFTIYLACNRYNRGLNKYPGPALASFTNWWRFYDVYKRRPEVTHQNLHAKHGDVVRLGPNTLSFADPKALKTIYGLNKGFVKSEFYPVQQSVSNGHALPSLFSTTSEPFHAQLRRSVNAAFSMSTLVQYEPLVTRTTEIFLSRTAELFTSPSDHSSCDFAKWLQFYAFDVIGEMTYSKRHGFLEENRDVDGIISYLGKLFDYVAPIGQIPILDRFFLKNPLYLLAAKFGLVDATFPVAKFAAQRVQERYPKTDGNGILPTTDAQVKTTKSQPDLLSKFIQAKHDRPEFMTDELVMTMAVSMAFAGSETTAISLSAVFYYLLKNERCMEKLMQEIDGKAQEGYFEDEEKGLVSWTESQGLPYLDACIKEAFRLHPAPGLPLERVVPEPGVEIAGEWVKGGTVVGCSAWVIHHRKEIFGEDVEVFRPERWLVGVGGEGGIDWKREREVEDNKIKEMNGAMLQFGMGARSCIGRNISLLEIYKLVPSMLRRFEIKLEYPEREWTLHNSWFVRQLDFRTTFRNRELVRSRSRSG